jgi:hypothetical protein
MNELKISCRIEEVPFVTQLVRGQFIRDQNSFLTFSKLFDSTYLEKFDKQANQVNDLVAPSLYTGEMKLITERIRSHYDKARAYANKVEFYAKKAGSSLNIKPADFGFKTLRTKLGLKDDEAVAKGLTELTRVMTINQPALEANGLTLELKTEVDNFVLTFTSDSLAQTRKLNEREQVVRQNAGQINALWALITEICDAGKIIGKEKKDKSMVKDYTITELVKSVRISHKKEETGEVTANAK